MSRRMVVVIAAFAALAVPAVAIGHDLDHPAPSFVPPTGPLSTEFNSGGRGASWDLIDTIFTGNPHTDIEFFTRGRETFASVGTLAVGPNAGGQTIVQLTRNGGVVDPRFRSSQPSATCISDPTAALGLQHDVEATPKGHSLSNASYKSPVRGNAQLLLDATDAPGRCHDQGTLGLINAPQGGLEIIDITNIDNPVEIGLTSHIGEAHTVNVDPKRPHIAYAVTSDSVTVTPDGKRANEDSSSTERFDLDGFEIVDLSSCMNFPAGTSVAAKRAACRPEVFRYRYPRAKMALGHTRKTGSNAIYGCHELEIYTDDRLTCGSGNAAIVFDLSRAFDDNGTRDTTDDTPRGTPLPCRVRDSGTVGPTTTDAKVTDCVVGRSNADLTVSGWKAMGSPSIRGVRWLGSVHHQGRGAGGALTPAYDATEDIDFNHETEFTRSKKFLLATDERGGGVVPPGATCDTPTNDPRGNGGVHAYRVDRLRKTGPPSPTVAHRAYARNRAGSKAIYRARPRTVVEPSFCTAHVFQQIPGQNRIFMGWYTQGTQVIDFEERRDGTFRFKEAGWFIPELANTWVSHIFKVRKNRSGTYTYWGATGDFNIDGKSGRNAIDVYKVTLPAPPRAAARRAAPRFTG